MTKKEALAALAALAGVAATGEAGAARLFWRRRRRRLAAAALLSGGLADGFLLYSFLVPNFPLGGRVFYRGSHSGNLIALTFDDGPRPPFTDQILNVLKHEGVRATFFVLGENALRYPEAVRRMEAEGHRVASHGMDHDILMWARPWQVRLQLALTSQAIEAAGVKDPARLFRAPHGWLGPAAHRAATGAGYQVAGWTKGVWDTAAPGVDKIISRTVELLGPGSVLLLHDGWRGLQEEDRSQTVAALPEIISLARSRGLAFATVEEMMNEAGLR